MQYAPPYYYAGGSQQSPNSQQPHQSQPQQQPQQQQQQPQQAQQPQYAQHSQHPQLHMPEHQFYAQHPHVMPPYQMPMPYPHHPSMVHPGDFNVLTKPKRKQVKNACVNCQKACKKCDDGRPCQRCIKYGLTETCTNSVRKERKKGVKRGPYKRRNQSNGEGAASPASGSTYSSGTPSATPTPYPTYTSYENYQSTNPNAPGMYSNPMQQYVMAMQQQQAMYSNLPYQQPMTPNSSSSSSLPQPTPLSGQASPAAPLSAHASPIVANAAITAPGQPSTNDKDTDDENGSKLNILSQLCSDVLDRPVKQEPDAATPPSTTAVSVSTPTHNQSGSDPVNTQQQPTTYNQQQQQPILSTPVSSSPSSANASPTLHKQDAPQTVYPQQQQQQEGQTGWQGQW